MQMVVPFSKKYLIYLSYSVTIYCRGGKFTARGPDPAHRSVLSGPLVPAETTTIVCMDINFRLNY